MNDERRFNLDDLDGSLDSNPVQQATRITIKWGGSNVFIPGTDDWDELMEGIESPITVDKVKQALRSHLGGGSLPNVPVQIIDGNGNEVSNVRGDYELTGTCTVAFLAPHGGLGQVS